MNVPKESTITPLDCALARRAFTCLEPVVRDLASWTVQRLRRPFELSGSISTSQEEVSGHDGRSQFPQHYPAMIIFPRIERVKGWDSLGGLTKRPMSVIVVVMGNRSIAGCHMETGRHLADPYCK
jgi:hypothetical protein